MKIDWSSTESHILTNPRASNAIPSLPELSGHLWITTSGTTGNQKWVALSKEAFLVSARGVNAHLESNQHDTWLHVLPDFHVGGLGIWARSQLSGANVIKLEKWDPEAFVCAAENATLSALVPTQVFDLVQNGYRAPEKLRAIVVGGGYLTDALYERALVLGWPLLPSYGMSECCSQIATGKVGNRDLVPLSHVQLWVNDSGRICIKSPALLTCYFTDKVVDPKIDGWFESSDLGELDSSLRVLGRVDDVVKISGELVNVKRLEAVLDEIRLSQKFDYDVAIRTQPDDRLGHVIVLYSTSHEIERLVNSFNAQVLPFERIKTVQYMEKIPRNALGKLTVL